MSAERNYQVAFRVNEDAPVHTVDIRGTNGQNAASMFHRLYPGYRILRINGVDVDYNGRAKYPFA